MSAPRCSCSSELRGGSISRNTYLTNNYIRSADFRSEVVAQEIQYIHWQPSTKAPDERLSRFDVVPLDLDHSPRRRFLLRGLFFIGEFREEGDRRRGHILLLSEHAEPQWMILEMNLQTR
jgi:hypothetical protein